MKVGCFFLYNAMVLFWFFPLQIAFSESMIQIPVGAFLMGEVDHPASHRKKRVLDDFWIDRFEVKNAEFSRLFPEHSYPAGADRHPVSLVTWKEAKRYCERLNKHLPTESEWEKAARDPDGRKYPWGNKKLRRKAHPSISGMVKRNVGFNKRDVSIYGVRDMAASVWEWTMGDIGENKIARGGVWNHHLDYDYSATYEKIEVASKKRYIFLSFRCVR